MAIDVNIPSQVKNYANLAAFPATGTLKTIFIAEDTNKTYRWTGSAYVEVSGADLSGYVPTTRTLTINGTTQDLSADRTFTISTGITIGTTAITSGTVGRVLFEGTGNVVSESANLFWDNTNARLGLGTATPSAPLGIVGSTATTGLISITNNFSGQYPNAMTILFPNQTSSSLQSAAFYVGKALTSKNGYGFNYIHSADTSNANRGSIAFYGVDNILNWFASGNVTINTTTDAGFKLDVNGTARVQGSLTIPSTANFGISITRTGTLGIAEQIYNNGGTTYLGADSSAGGFLFTGGLPYASFFGNGANYPTQFGTNGATRMTIFANGNIGINTTTDAGFKLDVNGTARVSGQATFGATNAIGTESAIFSVNTASNSFIRIYNPNTTAGAGVGIVFTNNLSGNSSSQIWGDGVGTTGNTLIRFVTSIAFTATEKMRISPTTGNLLINTTTDIASSKLTIESTTQGFLPPRMTTTQKNAIASPVAGLMVYDTTLNVITYYNGTTWI